MTTTYDRERGGHRFRPAGDPTLRPTAATCQRWFVTAHTTRRLVHRDGLVERPSSTAHAKRMGSTVTACGVPATSWPKLWWMPFLSGDEDWCADCRALVGSTGGRVAPPALPSD